MEFQRQQLIQSEPNNMHRIVLGKKQKEDNEKFNYVWNNIGEFVSKDHIDNLIDKTLKEVNQVIRGKRIGYAWSGGKDSVALEFIMKQAGVHRCVMGMTDELEYPEFMQFVTNNMPEDLFVYNSGHTLDWLANNLDWLFPKTSKEAARWFKAVQHKAQVEFYRKHNLDLICLGRRLKDSNYIGKGGNIYHNKSQNVTRYSPIAYWSHEETLGLMRYYDLPVAPFYSWPNGWVVGSGNWAARQWVGSIENGWKEVYQIDPKVVQFASTRIQSAYEFIKSI